MNDLALKRELIQVARGERPAHLVIKNGTVINVYSGELLPANVAIYGDRIAYVGSREDFIGEETEVIDAEGYYLSPGYIEPHAHPWVLYNPVSLVAKVLPLGTTTIVNDNLFFYLHMGPDGFKKMVHDLEVLPGNLLWLVRIVSQADFPGEREWFATQRVKELLQLDQVVGTAEVTRWPLLYKGDPFALEPVMAAKERGKISDGHTAGCSYDKLNAIVASGIDACHEAITAQEVLDRLRLGMWATLRNSSLRPDLPEIIKVITEEKVDTRRLLLTTDGPHPAFIEEEGCVDGLLRKAVSLGLAPVEAIQMVTINPATYLHLDHELGGVAPGRRADLLLLPDLVNFRPHLVIAGGKKVAQNGRLEVPLPEINWDGYLSRKPFQLERERLLDPRLYRFPHGGGKAPVIHFKIAVITSKKEMELPSDDGYADISHHPQLVYAALIDRRGRWISRGILENFATSLEGLATTYNTTTELLVIGRNPEAMAQAAGRVHDLGGGICVVEGGKPILEIPLPLTGMMTPSPHFDTAVRYQNQFLRVMKERGYPFHDILYTLLFLTCDFLPGLRLVPYGLYDVKADQIVRPAEPLG